MSNRVQYDGWTAEINSSCPPEMAAFIRNQPHRLATEKAEWIADLRRRGVKAAHPDDGWVDREAGTIHLCYPLFNDGLSVGDLLALGYPGNKTRIVRVVEAIMASPILIDWPRGKPFRWRFEAAGDLA